MTIESRGTTTKSLKALGQLVSIQLHSKCCPGRVILVWRVLVYAGEPSFLLVQMHLSTDVRRLRFRWTSIGRAFPKM